MTNRYKPGQRVIINDRFRRRLGKYLNETGLLLSDFSELCKVSEPVIQRILYTEDKVYTLDTIDKICCFMGWNYLSLFDEVEAF